MICCTITMLSNLLSCLLCKLTSCLFVLVIKALKVPGVALQSAIVQLGCLIRCSVEHLLMLFLNNFLNAIQKVIGLFCNLVVDIGSRLVTTGLKGDDGGLLKKMRLGLKELVSSFMKMVMKTMSTSIHVFVNFGVDVVSRLVSAIMMAGGEVVKKIPLVLHELVKLIASCWKMLLVIGENIILFYNLMLEVVPRWLEAVGDSIDQMMLAFNELLELIKTMSEAVRGFIERLSPVIFELIKRIVGMLHERVVDFVVEHVKQLVFGFVFGSIVMSEYHLMIQRVMETVIRGVVENFMTMVMYFFSRKIESIQVIR
ncbi:hypothetical protein QVD17_19131 [Tagetes erecta]|uniref:Uncharacterized protein n=1 Tax=Tagetes erecta TaxID=13708 RepID=A0AAD8KP45_TARER|nr:hypothetical protein QVD17_19131 [Tagetes erecta]